MTQPAIAAPTQTRSRPPAKTPGTFHARCGLLRWVPEKKLTPTELRESKEAGLARRYFELDSGRRTPGQARKGRWEVGYPACEGFETEDRAAYAEHMKAAHGRGTVHGYSETFARSVRSGWRAPALKAEGKPLAKEAASQLRHCSNCNLYGEVVGNAGELWWDEHVRGCALVAAGAAS